MDFSNIIQSVFSEMDIEPEDIDKVEEAVKQRREQLENLEQRVEELEKAL